MPLITGSWTQIDQSVLDAVDALGRPMHFNKAGSRTQIASLAAQFGFPLIGIFISGSGSAPDAIIERHSFPDETGSATAKPDKLGADMDAQLNTIYTNTVGTETSKSFWSVTHFWNYQASKLYTPRSQGSGDFALYISNDSPPSNWWQGF